MLEGSKKRRPRSILGKKPKIKGLQVLRPQAFGPYDRFRLVVDDVWTSLGGPMAPSKPGEVRAQAFFLRPGEEFDYDLFEDAMADPTQQKLLALPPHIVFLFATVDMGQADPFGPETVRNVGATPVRVGVTPQLQSSRGSRHLKLLEQRVANYIIEHAYGIEPQPSGGMINGLTQ